ncbi:MAG: alpha/beta hydrolase [Elusimicrobiota bacterium]
MLSNKIAYWIIGLVLLWTALRWFERANLYFPSAEHYAHPGAYAFPYEEVWLTSADGVRLHAWFIDAEKENTSRYALNDPPLPPVEPLKSASAAPPVIVFFHGNGGNISHRLQKLRILRGMGLSVLLFDYRGYGKSAGRPSELGTYLDGLAAVEYLTRDRGIPLARLAYHGESLGCAIALETALKRPPRALILDSAFTSTADMARIIFPFLPVDLLIRYRYDNLGKIADLKAPVLFLHSEEDDIVPYAMGRRLFAAAPEAKSFVAMRGDHNEGFLDTPYYGKEIRQFLSRYFP